MTRRQPETRCCAVILSGGLNSRMSGQNKAFLEVGGTSILNRLIDRLQPYFQDILLVTRQPELYAAAPVRVVVDIFEARSSITGIHAGLVETRTEYAFVVPCDTPLLQPAIIETLLDELAPGLDVVVPVVEGFYEPLCAIYSRRCIPIIEAQITRGNYRIFDFFKHVNAKELPTERIKSADPELLSFFNINTPSALLACEKLIRQCPSAV